MILSDMESLRRKIDFLYTYAHRRQRKIKHFHAAGRNFFGSSIEYFHECAYNYTYITTARFTVHSESTPAFCTTFFRRIFIEKYLVRFEQVRRKAVFPTSGFFTAVSKPTFSTNPSHLSRLLVGYPRTAFTEYWTGPDLSCSAV